jgi:hypothetical protein
MRALAIGPAAAANPLFSESLSLEKGYMQRQLVYYVLVVVSGAALAFGTFLDRFGQINGSERFIATS